MSSRPVIDMVTRYGSNNNLQQTLSITSSLHHHFMWTKEYLIAEVSLAVLSDSAPEMTSGSSSSDTPITDLSLITSSSDALYSFNSLWTASATLGKGLRGGRRGEGEERGGEERR